MTSPPPEPEFPPQIIVISGPNGAGKSTSAAALIPPRIPYINADEIAKELSGAVPGKDIQAGRQMRAVLDDLEASKVDFALETTLASKSLALRIRRLRSQGYLFHLHYFWLPSIDICLDRVAERVRRGGHNIPEETVRRRYVAGARNLLEIYMPLADHWQVLQNLDAGKPEVIAELDTYGRIVVGEENSWGQIRKVAQGK